MRTHWLQHKEALEKFLRSQEGEMKAVLERRAAATLKRELQAAKDSYEYRLRELQDRNREQQLRKFAKELVRQQVEAEQKSLFEEFRQEAEWVLQELEEQVAVLRQDLDGLVTCLPGTAIIGSSHLPQTVQDT